MAFSDENQNFFRLYYVLMKFGTKALNELLRCLVHQTFPLATTLGHFLALPQVQKNLCPARRRGYLDPMQKELLYPSGAASTTIDYEDLDITLVTVLLKNLTVFSGFLKQPTSCSRTLWINPTEQDQLLYRIEANVVLLKNKRNSMVHSKIPSITNDEFEANFDQVKSWVMIIMRRVGSTFNEDDIERHRKSPLLPEVFQETVAKLLESVEAAEGLQDEVKRLIEEQAQTEERLQHQIVRLTSKTRKRILLLVVSLVFVTVVIFGVLVWNRVSADQELRKGVKSRENLEKKLEEIKGSLNSKTSTEAKTKEGIGLARVQLRRETGQGLEIRKQQLRGAIKMHPDICSSWKNKDEKIEEKQIENCVDWLLKSNRRASFHSLQTTPDERKPMRTSMATPLEMIKNALKRFESKQEAPKMSKDEL